jgi:hypothetical protein
LSRLFLGEVTSTLRLAWSANPLAVVGTAHSAVQKLVIEYMKLHLIAQGGGPLGRGKRLVNPSVPANTVPEFIAATLFDNLNFDFIRDIVPVAAIMRVPEVMARPGMPRLPPEPRGASDDLPIPSPPAMAIGRTGRVGLHPRTFTRIFHTVWRESSKSALFAKVASSLGYPSPIMANIRH